MYQGRKFLGVIPARGGSKGVPRKNIRDLAGRPLIAWTIAEAKKSRYLDRCIVSTEDAEIKKIAEEFGGEVPFLRPKEMAQDSTASIDVVLDVLEKLPGYDYVVLLQPPPHFVRQRISTEQLLFAWSMEQTLVSALPRRSTARTGCIRWTGRRGCGP